MSIVELTSAWDGECREEARHNNSVITTITHVNFVWNPFKWHLRGKTCDHRKAEAPSDLPSSAEVRRAQWRRMQGRKKRLQYVSSMALNATK